MVLLILKSVESMKPRFFLLIFFFLYFSALKAQERINDLHKAYEQAKNEKNDILAGNYALALADAYVALNRRYKKAGIRFKSVVHYYKSAIKYADSAGDSTLMAKAQMKLAALYNRHPKHKKDVIPMLEKARQLYYFSDDTMGYAEVQLAAAKVFRSRHDYRRSAPAMVEALDYFEKAEHFDRAQDCARDLADIYRQIGNDNKADFYQDEATRLSNSSRELARRDLLIARKQDSLLLQQRALRHQKDSIARKEAEIQAQRLEVANQKKTVYYSVSVLFLVVISLFFVLRAKRKISVQKKEVEALLLNILPKKTAEELRLKGSATPRSYARVSVLFTDFKGFTQVAEKMTPEEIIEELGICFSAFDQIVEEHKMEKIKTIGDAYMCAGGIPEPNQSNPADAVRTALAMQQFMQERIALNRREGRPILALRIGIHTGAVVAGVVGKKKFAYDIWGDAVNIAARMEAGGEVDKVNISGETHALVKDQFRCTYRGKIPAKNKGEIDMYFVDAEI